MADYSLSQLNEDLNAADSDLIEVSKDNGNSTFTSRKQKRSTLLTGKVNQADLDAHTTDTANPHAVSKAQVGLGNVENTDATKRANHTGTQSASTISDFQATVSSNTDVTANTTDRHTHANKSTLDATTAAYTTAKDGKLSGVDTDATKNDTDTNLKNRANHTGTQIASTISDLSTAVSNNTNVAANTAARHSHSNKALLDTYTQTEANLADAVNKKHDHANKGVLDTTTASFTTAKDSRLSGIETGAEVNVQSDWNVASSSSDAFIKNKPTLGTLASKDKVSVGDINATGTPSASTVFKGDGSWGTAGDSLPDQTGNAGKALFTDGTDPGWQSIPGGGDMLKSTYDPNSKAADTFSMGNMVETSTEKILTSAERTKLSNTSGVNTGDQSTVSGNAGTATKLATARNINGVAFDGSANITVADATKVPTTRTVNSKALSSNITLNNTDVGAAATSHTHTAANITDFSTAADARITAANKKTDSMATNKLLGRGTASTGPIEEITLGTNLSLTGTTLNAAGGGGGGGTWGSITGTLADQTDLNSALGAKALDADVVHDTGNETVAGVKTFSSSPVVPTPTTDYQSATKKYVDDNSGGGASLPSQTGQTGKFLKTDGSALSWDTPAGGGGGSSDVMGIITTNYESTVGGMTAAKSGTGDFVLATSTGSYPRVTISTGATSGGYATIGKPSALYSNALALPWRGASTAIVGGSSGSGFGYLNFARSSPFGSLATSDQIAIMFDKVSGTITPYTATGNGTSQELQAISGIDLGLNIRYSFNYNADSTVDFYADGVLKNTHSTSVYRTGSSIVMFLLGGYMKNTSSDTMLLYIDSGQFEWKER